MTTMGSSMQSNPNVLAFNERVIRRRFPDLVHVVDAYRSKWPESVRVQESRSGLPTISVTAGLKTTHVHSTFEPVIEAERWVREPAEGNWDCAVVFGAGLGYHLEALIQRKPHSRLVVIEPRPDVFYVAVAVREQNWLTHPYLTLIVTEDPVRAARELIRTHLKDLLNNVPLLIWPPSERYAPAYRSTLESTLVDTLRQFRTDVATRQVFSTQWVSNFLQNARVAVADPGVSSLQGRFRGRPAIVVAAGPSLEKNGHLLRKAKGKALIIAAGSAIRPLLTLGIEPDLVVSFDGAEANYLHFKGLNTPRVPLVYAPIIFPRILEEYAGPRFTVALDPYPFVGWLFKTLGEDKGTLSSGPSVANIAWHFAYSLDMNPIILVGQDLAFTGGKTHAAGAAHARQVDLDSPDDRTLYITTEGIDGSPVITNYPMYSMKVWFEQRLMAAAPGHLTIDATEGGAKIAGTQLLTLQEALDQYCHEDFCPWDILMDAHRCETERLANTHVSNQLAVVFRSLEEDLEQVAHSASEGLRSARLLWREAKTRKLTEQRFSEAHIRLSRCIESLERLESYRNFVQPAILHVSRAVELSRTMSWENESDVSSRGAALAQKHVALFSSVARMSRELRRLVREAIERERGDREHSYV